MQHATITGADGPIELKIIEATCGYEPVIPDFTVESCDSYHIMNGDGDEDTEELSCNPSTCTMKADTVIVNYFCFCVVCFVVV